ncbi:MarR family transcriptional regulator, partial [Pseudomonas aeruginosa]
LAQWRRERPDVDASPMAVCGEVWRAGERLRQGVIANIASADLDMAGFDVLLTLRRNGREQALSPSALAKD